MNIISALIVLAFGLSLIGFAVLAFVKRLYAENFLELFASSARSHFTEQILRLVVGTALIIFSPSMWYSDLFRIFGWIIVVTTVGLIVIPWRWHQGFAQKVIPLVIRFLAIYGIASFVLGAFILSLTYIPMMSSLFLSKKVTLKKNGKLIDNKIIFDVTI